VADTLSLPSANATLRARRLFQSDAHAIVDVRHTRRHAVRARCDDGLEELVAGLHHRHYALRAEREVRAAADVERNLERNLCEVNVQEHERDVLARAIDRHECCKVVEAVPREVDRDGRRIFVRERQDEDRVAEEVLQIKLEINVECGRHVYLNQRGLRPSQRWTEDF
jgi:hypothetical protein